MGCGVEDDGHHDSRSDRGLGSPLRGPPRGDDYPSRVGNAIGRSQAGECAPGDDVLRGRSQDGDVAGSMYERGLNDDMAGAAKGRQLPGQEDFPAKDLWLCRCARTCPCMHTNIGCMRMSMT